MILFNLHNNTKICNAVVSRVQVKNEACRGVALAISSIFIQDSSLMQIRVGLTIPKLSGFYTGLLRLAPLLCTEKYGLAQMRGAGKEGGGCLPPRDGFGEAPPQKREAWLHSDSLGGSWPNCRRAVKGSKSREVERHGSVALRRFGRKRQAGVCCLRLSASHVGGFRCSSSQFIPFGVDKPH